MYLKIYPKYSRTVVSIFHRVKIYSTYIFTIFCSAQPSVYILFVFCYIQNHDLYYAIFLSFLYCDIFTVYYRPYSQHFPHAQSNICIRLFTVGILACTVIYILPLMDMCASMLTIYCVSPHSI